MTQPTPDWDSSASSISSSPNPSLTPSSSLSPSPSPNSSTRPVNDKFALVRGVLPKRASEPRSLSYQDTYICPVCRHGHIAELTLMDAFACNFCRHIFTANLKNQTVQVVDSAQPLSWRWNGRNWQSIYRDDPSLTAVVWFASTVLVLLPASIVGLMSYLFPPLPGSIWSWFPTIWLGCTFSIHLLMVSWLLAEHYQIPLYVASRVRLRDWLGRR